MDQEGLLFPKPTAKKKTKKHMPSILFGDQKDVCYLCGSRYRIEEHHIFGGTGNRTNSEGKGMKVHLCAECHREGPEAVHRYREANLYLKRTAQRQFERDHTRQQFREIFGKSYLE